MEKHINLEKELEKLKRSVRTIPGFPKPSIMFRDITTLLKDKGAFNSAIELLINRYIGRGIDKVVGVESRGFIVGGVLAHRLGVGFVPARKPGKLPGEASKVEYELEYGKDALEIHNDAISYQEKVLIVDDLLATGGTALAAVKLVEGLGGKVVGCSFIIELPDLKGREKLVGYDVFSLIAFEGD